MARKRSTKRSRSRNWISSAIKRPGAFSKKAKSAGRSTTAHARSVLKKGSRASTTTKRQAALALTLAKMRSRRRRSK